MRNLLLSLSILFSVYAIAAPCGNEEKGKSCSKEKKCCKSGAAQGKACCKNKTGEAANSDGTKSNEVVSAADAASPAPAGKSCCKNKAAAKKCPAAGGL